ncbi:uncharacterized protein N7469_004290 [Penicillium citrinum]|uniref:Ribosomal protein S15 n=2 Tax=Penicillium TaxID=5073 RepID=A0A9W9P6V3_PENCI|nr:uncharacterized protein N7469_004290 [Penicillium citrinum]KAJ5235122.1 hypothetical protein N7469_004290 [Penicillium citrinum]KAJ5590741.1 hypothetical protein N7450_004713 [Penicillium hetheringtonii]
MPPRLLFQPSVKAFAGSISGQSPLVSLSHATRSTVRAASTKSKPQQKTTDFFRASQARQRKAANISRQKVLQAEREASLGDPVESQPTPFIQELQAIQSGTQIASNTDLNYYLKSDELSGAFEFSKDLTEPLQNPDRDTADPQAEKEITELHNQQHKNAEEAIKRIVNLNNGNTKDRLRLIVQKCIEQFGRHTTDTVLPPKPASVQQESATNHLEKVPRVGPDTGSPEVQVAILTAKILNLSRHLQSSNKDKHNRRNLQILVHKRQKLLQYVRRKERGGPRWQNLMETLGLSEAAWKGEICL